MIGKLIALVVLLAMLVFSVGFFYQSLPGEPVELEVKEIVPEPIEIVDYGAVPVFADNLRFNHKLISYFISDECSDVRRNAMIRAFVSFEDEMGIVSFNEVSSEADIEVGCSDDYIPLGEQLFAAGEGGPSRIINASVFKTIEKGKISLYHDPRCDYPVVEVHELCHVFGFDHSMDPGNIMYNISSCKQRISEDMVKLINGLYSIDPLPDAVITDVAAVKRGRYLDFNVTVLNEGMMEIDSINLSIFANGEFVQDMDFGEIGIGYGRTLRTTGTKLSSRNIKSIDFIVDEANLVEELNEANNAVQMILSPQ